MADLCPKCSGELHLINLDRKYYLLMCRNCGSSFSRPVPPPAGPAAPEARFSGAALLPGDRSFTVKINHSGGKQSTIEFKDYRHEAELRKISYGLRRRWSARSWVRRRWISLAWAEVVIFCLLIWSGLVALNWSIWGGCILVACAFASMLGLWRLLRWARVM